MKDRAGWESKTLHSRLRFFGLITLFLGLGSALIIYFTAGDNPETVMGYEIIGGEAYLVSPENEKKYIHDLQTVGGKSAVLADEFSRWFVRLWHGKALAGTVAVLSIITALLLFLIAYGISVEMDNASGQRDNHAPDG